MQRGSLCPLDAPGHGEEGVLPPRCHSFDFLSQLAPGACSCLPEQLCSVNLFAAI